MSIGIPNFQIRESRGFEVFLVNAHYLKSVPGRKSDVSDCQWIQYLHSVGLLQGSFRPPDEICAVRTLWRHRQSLLQMAAEHILHIQKSLSQMNVQVHHVLSDITGFSGMMILDAILAGERDCFKLAQLCHPSVKSPREKVAQALEGDYRIEHLFTLRQSLAGYRYYQQQIAELDDEIQRLMKTLPSSPDAREQIPDRTKRTRYQRQGNDPAFNLRVELYRIAGVDLTDIPGVSAITAQVILTEIGPDVSRFRNASAFASWLGLCPGETSERREGAVVQDTQSQKPGCHSSPAQRPLTLPGKRLLRGFLPPYASETRNGTSYHTATAHKIARILYHVMRTKEPYVETIFHKYDEHARQRAELRLRKQAAQLGFQVIPTAGQAS